MVHHQQGKSLFLCLKVNRIILGYKILGKSQGWKVERSGKFDWSMFPEYHHRRTTSMKDTTKPTNERDARMYIFEKFTKQDTAKQRKRGNGNGDSDDDDSDNDD